MHHATNVRPAFFVFFFCSRDVIDTTIQKNTQAVITFLKKEEKKKASLTFVLHMRFKYCMRLKFQTETRKIEEVIAVLLLVLITTCLMYKNRLLVTSRDGSRIGQCI